LAGESFTGIYGAIAGASSSFFEAPHGGGVLGLAFSDPSITCNTFTCFPSFWDLVVSTGTVMDVFSVGASSDDPLAVSVTFNVLILIPPMHHPFRSVEAGKTLFSFWEVVLTTDCTTRRSSMRPWPLLLIYTESLSPISVWATAP